MKRNNAFLSSTEQNPLNTKLKHNVEVPFIVKVQKAATNMIGFLCLSCYGSNPVPDDCNSDDLGNCLDFHHGILHLQNRQIWKKRFLQTLCRFKNMKWFQFQRKRAENFKRSGYVGVGNSPCLVSKIRSLQSTKQLTLSANCKANDWRRLGSLRCITTVLVGSSSEA